MAASLLAAVALGAAVTAATTAAAASSTATSAAGFVGTGARSPSCTCRSLTGAAAVGSAALGGAGVTQVFDFMAREHLASGRLVAPLGFIPGRSRIVALTPIEGASQRALAFRDWLLAEGASTPLPPQAACDSRGGR